MGAAILCDRPVMDCLSSYRSARGVTTLLLRGYDNIQGFSSSFAAWQTVEKATTQKSFS
jgi:rhodanese-related sulfurtransferase